MAKTKTAAAKQKASAKDKSAGSKEVKVCRRTSDAERRGADDAAAESADVESALVVDADGSGEEANPPERRKVQRRRQIDPTTCERDYTGDEIEFMHALDAYKRANGRMFPTCSEILEVVRSLGYDRVLGTDTAAELEDGEAFTPDDDSERASSELGPNFASEEVEAADEGRPQIAGYH